MPLVKTKPTSRTTAPALEPRKDSPESSDDRVVIEYCVPGNAEAPARKLARDIEVEFGIRPRLVPSRGGVFEVSVAGQLVFSKKATWRFPEADEIYYHVRQLLG